MVMQGVEWDTLLFFGALFVMIEGLAEMGLIRMIANLLSDIITSIAVTNRQPVAIVLIMIVTQTIIHHFRMKHALLIGVVSHSFCICSRIGVWCCLD